MKHWKNLKSVLLAFVLVVSMTFSLGLFVHAEAGTSLTTQENLLTNFFNSEEWAKVLEDMRQPQGKELFVSLAFGEGLQLGSEEQQMLEQIGLRLKLIQDLSQEAPLMQFEAALFNPGVSEKELALNAYNVGNSLVVSIPGVIAKPILISEEMFADIGFDMAAMSPMSSVEEMIGLMEVGTEIFTTIEGIIAESATVLEPAQAELSLGEVSETLQVLSQRIPSEEFYSVLVRILESFRDDEMFLAFFNMIMDEAGMGYYYYSDDEEEGPTAQLDALIAEIQESEYNEPIALTINQYVDDQDQGRGFSLSLFNEESEEEICIDAYYLYDGNTAYPFVFSVRMNDGFEEADLFRLEINSELINEKLYGNFFLYIEEEGGEVLFGTFSDLALVEDPANATSAFLAGSIDATVRTVESTYVLVEPEETEEAEETEEGEEESDVLDPSDYEYELVEVETQVGVQYEGYIDGDQPKVVLTIIPDRNLETQSITITISVRTLAPEEIVIPTELPLDYFDLSNEEDMDALSEDPSIQENLFALLTELGLFSLFEAMPIY